MFLRFLLYTYIFILTHCGAPWRLFLLVFHVICEQLIVVFNYFTLFPFCFLLTMKAVVVRNRSEGSSIPFSRSCGGSSKRTVTYGASICVGEFHSLFLGLRRESKVSGKSTMSNMHRFITLHMIMDQANPTKKFLDSTGHGSDCSEKKNPITDATVQSCFPGEESWIAKTHRRGIHTEEVSIGSEADNDSPCHDASTATHN